MTPKKEQKKIKTFDFTKGKIDQKKTIKDTELISLLQNERDNLKKLLEKERQKNENYQKYTNALEDERDKIAKVNEELVEYANKTIKVAWTERVIVAVCWLISLAVAFVWWR